MGFVKKTWVDRAVQFANRRVHTPVPGMENTFDVTRAEGTVFTVGDKPNAVALNDLETRVYNAITGIEDSLDWIDITSQGTWSTSLITSLTYYARANPAIRMVEVVCILNPGRANNGVIFTLPSSYRPAITANMAIATLCYDNVKNMQIQYLVDTSGNIKGAHTINTPSGIYEYICFNFTY